MKKKSQNNKSPQKDQVHKSKSPETKNISGNSQKEKSSGVGFQKLGLFIENHPFLVSLFLILFIGCVAFQEFIFGERLYFFKDIGSDEVNGTFPFMTSFYYCSREGFFTSWSFFYGMGQSFSMGIPVHLSTLISYVIVWLRHYNDAVLMRFIITFVFEIILSGIVAYYYFKSLGLTKFTNILGSVLFAYCGYLILGSSWGHGTIVFSGIFLLFAFEQLYMKKRWYFFPLAIIFLSSNIFYLYLYGTFLILYILIRYFSENGFKVQGLLILGLKLLALSVLGFAINLYNLIPSYITMFNSPRFAGEASLMNTLASASPSEIATLPQLGAAILRLFGTDILGNGSAFLGLSNPAQAKLYFSAYANAPAGWTNYLEAPLFYCGIISILLIPQLFALSVKKDRWFYGVFLSIWVFILIFPYFRNAFHLFVGDYFKMCENFFITFVLLFLGMKAIDLIQQKNKLNLIVLGASLVVLIILLHFNYFPKGFKPVKANIKAIATLFLFGYTIVLLLFHYKNFKIFGKIALIGLVVVELIWNSASIVNKRETFTKDEYLATKFGYDDNINLAVDYAKSIDKSFYRMEKDYATKTSQHSSLNEGMVLGYFSTSGYSSFNQFWYTRFFEEIGLIHKGDEGATRWANGARNEPLLLTFANVKYNLSLSKEPAMMKFGFKPIRNFGNAVLLKNAFYLPFGYSYKYFIKKAEFNKLSKFQKEVMLLKAYVYEDLEQTLDITSGMKELKSADSVAAFSFEIYKTMTDSLKKDTFNTQNRTLTTFSGKAKMSEKKLLFFTIPYDPYWQIYVNGKKEKLSLANLGFMGILLDKGEYQIDLKYEPSYTKIGSAVSFLGLFIFALLLAFQKWGKKFLFRKNESVTDDNLHPDTK